MEGYFPTQRYYVTVDNYPIGFEEGLNGVSPIPYNEALSENTQWSDELIELIKNYQTDAQKILEKYPLGIKDIENLDFSNLELTHIPPQILLQCTTARTLDISGNQICWLPSQLQNLPLETLIISGNKGLQPIFSNFSWLLEMKDLTIIADDMGFNFVPPEWRETERFFSNEIPSDLDWLDYPTQFADQEEDN